jgi:glycosyltransferase involved in cell wall biosynthesis
MYLPFMPFAIERFRLHDYDLIISNSHAVAKGVLTAPHQLHICYAPARNLKYAYEDRDFYPHGKISGFIQDILLTFIRMWDHVATRRPNLTITLSRYVRDWYRVKHGIDSVVIYPPVDVCKFGGKYREDKDEYYITVGRLEPYKNMHLVVQAMTLLNKKLLVVGTGTEMERLKKMAGPTIEFLGYQNSDEVAALVSRAKVFVFASREDFGIAPVEAQACGTPVIAYGQGGVLETICGLDQERPTGYFFYEQTVDSLVDTIQEFEKNEARIRSSACRDNAQRFSAEVFCEKFKNYVLSSWEKFKNG